MKHFISVCCALMLGISYFSVAASAGETEPIRIYRTSVSGETEVGAVSTNNYNISYTATIEAFSEGLIHLEVNTVTASRISVNRIVGTYAFNDTFIQPFSESTDEKIQKSKETQHAYCKTTYSYDDSDIVYTLSTNDCTSFTYVADLYVREAYLKSTIPFTFFGKNIEIPFGTEAIPTGDIELQNTTTKLKAENEELSKKNTELSTKVSELETQNTELDTANKKYQTESENLKTQNQALSSSILKFETENNTLKDNLAAFDSDGDGFLTSADAQMILVYYAEYLAGATSGKTGDYAAFIQTFKGQ